VLRLDRDVYRVALREELVQPEGEQRSMSLRMPNRRSREQGGADCLFALVDGACRLRRQPSCRLADPCRLLTHDSAGLGLFVQTEGGLDPGSEGGGGECVVVPSGAAT